MDIDKLAASIADRLVVHGYPVKETCAVLGISKPTLMKEINSGRLKHYRVGHRMFVSHHAAVEWQRAREVETEKKNPRRRTGVQNGERVMPNPIPEETHNAK